MNAISPPIQAGPSGRRIKFIVWPAVAGVALLSGLISMLYLTGSLFMLEVYDRVLPSRSVPTLVGLGVLVLALYAFHGFFDLIRGRLLVRAALCVAWTGITPQPCPYMSRAVTAEVHWHPVRQLA